MSINKIVARAVRIETDEASGKLYIVFEIIDEKFKHRIKNDWSSDIELELNGKELKEIK